MENALNRFTIICLVYKQLFPRRIEMWFKFQKQWRGCWKIMLLIKVALNRNDIWKGCPKRLILEQAYLSVFAALFDIIFETFVENRQYLLGLCSINWYRNANFSTYKPITDVLIKLSSSSFYFLLNIQKWPKLKCKL